MITGGINVISATQAERYRIHLRFDDGTEQEVNFESFLSHSLHPDIRAYLDPVRFGSFRVEYGELVWGDYDLCFPVIDLYRNQIEHGERFETAA
ncbi:MAG: DUF2442 domain-containing protein [Sulfuritalea sp.]|nr:DUF2442 domain-containing protein [Sulfuritalea sp.]